MTTNPMPPDVPNVTCKVCNGQGWYAYPDKDGKPEQVQCETCHGTGEVQPGFDTTDNLSLF